jgi:hypothetical protein
LCLQRTLTDLKATGGETSYSGSITISEPGTVTLVGVSLAGLLAFCRRRK